MYRKGINILLIIILLIVISSCHRLRISGSKKNRDNIEMNSARFFNEVESNNIISRPISISKISILYENDNERRRLKANMKTDGKGSVLLSIRTFAGIEAARILVKKDTIKIADRINKIYYTGKTEQLAKKYGITYDFINLLFGDFKKLEEFKSRIRCENSKVRMEDHLNDVTYTIDCDFYKVTEVEGRVNDGTQEYKGYFYDFRNESGLIYPGIIKWELNGGRTLVNIEMDKLRRQENIELIFKIGSNYKRKSIR